MTLHHAGVVLGDNRNVVARLREDQRYHQDDLGWIDIAYHVGVDRSGNIFELRAPEFVGDTATSYDPTGHFLVDLRRRFRQRNGDGEPTPRSRAGLRVWAAQSFHISTDTLAGHRDFAATSCPGANLYAHLASGDLKRRIDDLLAAGPVDLQPFVGRKRTQSSQPSRQASDGKFYTTVRSEMANATSGWQKSDDRRRRCGVCRSGSVSRSCLKVSFPTA